MQVAYNVLSDWPCTFYNRLFFVKDITAFCKYIATDIHAIYVVITYVVLTYWVC